MTNKILDSAKLAEITNLKSKYDKLLCKKYQTTTKKALLSLINSLAKELQQVKMSMISDTIKLISDLNIALSKNLQKINDQLNICKNLRNEILSAGEKFSWEATNTQSLLFKNPGKAVYLFSKEWKEIFAFLPEDSLSKIEYNHDTLYPGFLVRMRSKLNENELKIKFYRDLIENDKKLGNICDEDPKWIIDKITNAQENLSSYSKNGIYSYLCKYEFSFKERVCCLSNTVNRIFEKYEPIVKKSLSDKIINISKCLNFGLSKDIYTNLVFFDIKSEMQMHKTVDMPNALDESSYIIQLPNNKLLCHREKPNPRNWYIIDTLTFKYRILPNSFLCWFLGGVYHNNSIYIFGKNAAKLNSALEFDMNVNKWKKLPNLPISHFRCSCIAFSNSILICGDIAVYKFDTKIESYSTIVTADNLEVRPRFLMEGGRRAYLIDFKGMIYESNVEDEYSWSLFCRFLGKPRLGFSYKWSDNSVWFGFSDKLGLDYYKLSIDKKQVKKIEAKGII
ncbi:unnamed protein product [Blepharisma stoltei]|uniref:Uncharacterized protein n=1 Tax=Blepharisma stoltei TaxID=1481888 RepID=A0AAU9IK77_9CILI|nr:unnamed protein product [Blepharisma stoltei]